MVYSKVSTAETTATFHSNLLLLDFRSFDFTLSHAGVSNLTKHIHNHFRDRHVGDQADMAVYGMNTEYNKGNIV